MTNGIDAYSAPGPYISVGSPVLWTYVVTNTGDVFLAQVAVIDDKGVTVSCPKNSLEPGESIVCTAAGTAGYGQYENKGTATGTPGAGSAVTDWYLSHYFGGTPMITIEKRVNGQDADDPPGPTLFVGSPVSWTYVLTNTGGVRLTNVRVSDDKGVTVSCPKTVLEPAESMTCTATGTAMVGQYLNIGTATGTAPAGNDVTASDPCYYSGQVGNEGCTPGYWKNHTGSWPPTGYSTSQDVDTVFPNVNTYYPALGDATLVVALAFGGGPGGEGAAEILLRAAVAALLNASHPDVAYPRTTASVIADVNAALLQTRDTMLALAAQLDADNNRGCPLH